MSVVLESVTPLFAVIFLGWFAGRAGYLGEAGIRGLGAFVFNFAIPPYVFRLMAETDLEAITEWGFLGGYLIAQVLVFATGASIGRLAFGMRIAELTIQAFGSAFSNGVMLALPLLLWLYGDRGGVPALLIITLDVDRVQLGDRAARDRPARRRRHRLADRRPGRALGRAQPDPDGHGLRYPLQPERPPPARGRPPDSRPS